MAMRHAVEDSIYLLQLCKKQKRLESAMRAHARVFSNGLESHQNIGNYMVPMFVECGSVPDAQEVFNRLIHPNVHSWTSLICGYIHCGQSQHALSLYGEMQQKNVDPSSFTLVALLRACARLKDLKRGQKIHDEIIKKGLEENQFISSSLIDMYAKCGSIAEAREVFDKLPVCDVVSWNALIAGYVDNGHNEEALKCFDLMQLEGVPPDVFTFATALKACASIAAIEKGRNIHKEISQKDLQRDVFIGSSLVYMYAKCGSLPEAQEAFDKLPVRNVVSWNALIAGYVEHGFYQKALECFKNMQLEASPDAITFACTLKACASLKDIDSGRGIHTMVAANGLERHPHVASGLIDMYAKCSSLKDAQNLFDKLPFRNVVSWTALIVGYAEHGSSMEALRCFEKMQEEGVSPDVVTYICSINACTSIGAIGKGRAIHADVTKKGFGGDSFIGNALLDMYAKCGMLADAQEVFHKMPLRDAISWNTLVVGYVQHGLGQEALKCYEQMQAEGIRPDAVTYVSLFNACGSIGAVLKGRDLHTEIEQQGFERDVFIGNSLIDMYARCGSLTDAKEVFDKLRIRNIVSWNALIRGYSLSHAGEMAEHLFEDMQRQGIKPDAITFTCLLTACSRACHVLKGTEYFRRMREHYSIMPITDHYNCMIDLFARSGYLYEAEKLMKKMPIIPSKETWIELLGACKTYSEIELGRKCFEELVKMNPGHAVSYALMANIYSSTGRWDDAKKIVELGKCAGAKKVMAKALIEVDNKLHEFVVGDNQSWATSAILEALGSRMKQEGYVPNLDLVLRPVNDEEKAMTLCGHAERLAIAFGLLHTPQGQSLHMSKNLRMCNDCHNAFKIISQIEKRQIVLQESSWVHHFKSGLCDCGDMW